MGDALLLAVAAGLCWTLVGTVNSQAARRRLQFFALMSVGTGVTCVGTALALVRWGPLFGGEAPGAARLLWVTPWAGLSASVGFRLMQTAFRRGPHGIIWSVGQSALVVPFVVASAVFGEPLTGWKAVGVAAVLASIALFGASQRRSAPRPPPAGERSARWFVYALGAFACLGMTQTLASVPSHWHDWTDVAHLRVPLLLAGACVGYTGFAVAYGQRPGRTELAFALVFALAGAAGNITAFAALDAFAEFEMVGAFYPIGVAVCLLGFSTYVHLAYGERYTRPQMVAFALGLTGILTLAFGGM